MRAGTSTSVRRAARFDLCRKPSSPLTPTPRSIHLATRGQQPSATPSKGIRCGGSRRTNALHTFSHCPVSPAGAGAVVAMVAGPAAPPKESPRRKSRSSSWSASCVASASLAPMAPRCRRRFSGKPSSTSRRRLVCFAGCCTTSFCSSSRGSLGTRRGLFSASGGKLRLLKSQKTCPLPQPPCCRTTWQSGAALCSPFCWVGGPAVAP
mmetsp:Transcript_13923/g.39409  ORF Transcript_13923/g.39409 Transcript_13923/m.39409 type:complete len:208 (+) Transcript_13923:79-702(+)